MKKWSIAIALVVISATFGGDRAYADIESISAFNIKKEPKRSDWQYFHQASERVRYQLWRTQKGLGNKLGDWAWGWRLGWVRACGKSKKKYCRTILTRALFDDALVVRAEAASVIGRRYEGTGKKEAVEALAKSYRLAENFRGGKPLFVTDRILFALKQIGGPTAMATGPKLAAKHERTSVYWKKIANR